MFKLFQAVKVSLLADGKMGASVARAQRIRVALSYTK